jgi:hypothetical protein
MTKFHGLKISSKKIGDIKFSNRTLKKDKLFKKVL